MGVAKDPPDPVKFLLTALPSAAAQLLTYRVAGVSTAPTAVARKVSPFL